MDAYAQAYLRLADVGGGFFHYAVLSIEPNRLTFREWGDDGTQPIVLDGHLIDADQGCDLFLPQTEIHPAFAEVIARVFGLDG